MNYTVTWKPSAKDRLAEIWMAAPDRFAVAGAANAIDRLLGVDPLRHGESRSGTCRILVVEPLAVVYDAHELDRLVEVLSVRHVPRRPQTDT